VNRTHIRSGGAKNRSANEPGKKPETGEKPDKTGKIGDLTGSLG
jgi:hypothetical protein